MKPNQLFDRLRRSFPSRVENQQHRLIQARILLEWYLFESTPLKEITQIHEIETQKQKGNSEQML